MVFSSVIFLLYFLIENRNNNLNNSLSPITNRKNEFIDSYRNLNLTERKNKNQEEGNLSYFEEFNVKINNKKFSFFFKI